MSYSDLLAHQDKELERLNQAFYADYAKISELQRGHYDPSRFDGELDRLKGAFERDSRAMQGRFEQERKTFLKEPVSQTTDAEPAKEFDLSASQDKANEMLNSRRQQISPENKSQPTPQPGQKETPSGRQEINKEELERMKQDTSQRRQAWQQRRRGGHKQ